MNNLNDKETEFVDVLNIRGFERIFLKFIKNSTKYNSKPCMIFITNRKTRKDVVSNTITSLFGLKNFKVNTMRFFKKGKRTGLKKVVVNFERNSFNLFSQTMERLSKLNQ